NYPCGDNAETVVVQSAYDIFCEYGKSFLEFFISRYPKAEDAQGLLPTIEIGDHMCANLMLDQGFGTLAGQAVFLADVSDATVDHHSGDIFPNTDRTVEFHVLPLKELDFVPSQFCELIS